MGGLAGYFAPQSLELSAGATLLGRMMDMLGERCPNSQRGSVSGPKMGLGMRAPKTVPKGPYRNTQANMAWAYSGRIRVKAHNPDTPLLRQVEDLYERWQEGMFRSLDGSFAVVVWDGESQSLLLARDIFGQQPLFFSWVDGGRMLLFASEAKALLATRRVTPKFDGRSILDVLSCGTPLSPRSLFAGIEQLPPGSWIKVNAEGKEYRGQYYRSPYRVTGQTAAESKKASLDISEEMEAQSGDLRGLIRGVVDASGTRTGLWIRQDPASVLLASLLSESNTQLTLFSMGFESGKGTSFTLGEQLAEKLETEYAGVPLDRVEVSDYGDVVRALELPVLGAEAFFCAQLYAAVAADQQSVLWSSLGAESIFWGRSLNVPAYPGWFRRFWAPFQLRRFSGLPRMIRNVWRISKRYQRRWGAVPSGLESWGLTAHIADTLFHKRHKPSRGPSRLPHRLVGAPLFLDSATHRVLRVHQKTHLEGLLWQNDRMSTWAGIETQHPFIDQRLVNYSARLSPRSLSRGAGLQVLRQAIPKSLGGVFRKCIEQPFSPPNPIWPFGLGMQSWIKEVLAPTSLDALGLFDSTAVTQMLEDVSGANVDRVAQLQARALNGVLGLQLLGRTFGIEDIDWG